MPVSLTYPGVYVEEIANGVRTITGVSTSVTAFVGYAAKGPLNKAVKVFNFSEYTREFGGLSKESELGYAVSQFFLNGGSEAWIVRVSRGAKEASIAVKAGAKRVLTISAKTEGLWGNSLGIAFDYNTSNYDSTFNLTATEYASSNGAPVAARTEVHRNLSMDSASSRYAESVINAGSEIIKVVRHADVDDALLGGLAPGWSRSADLSTLNIPNDLPDEAHIAIMVDGDGPYDVKIYDQKPADLAVLAQKMQEKIRAVPSAPQHVTQLTVNRSDADGTVNAATGKFLNLVSGTPATKKREHSSVRIFKAAQNDVSAILKLGLGYGGKEQEAAAALRPPKDVESKLQSPVIDPFIDPVSGIDGDPPGAIEILGDRLTKKGIYALEDVDIFNILCIPRTAKLPDAESKKVMSDSAKYCTEKRAFYIIDPPESSMLTKEMIKTWMGGAEKTNYAAVYFPHLMVPDPLDDYRLHAFPPSGTIAGLYARIDSKRGVWKAPAGTEATLAGVQDLKYVLSDMENGVLNQIAVNCIRTFPITGIISWGARTLKGADRESDNYKYIPVRRLALYIEESLYRGTQWVVFEPNDEPLWAQIRLNIGSFMHNLFRQGAFKGSTPKDAYFVKCDKETTTQNDINLGIVNIIVGFAPLKPAEFVVIKIQQIAGEIQT